MDNEKDKGPEAFKPGDEKEKEKKGEELEKSVIDGAISALEDLLKASPAGRREELLTKALRGPLSDEENQELRKSLGGAPESDLSAEVTGAMQSDELAKSLSLDVTGFLKEVHGGVSDALDAVAARLEKGFKQQDELGFVLAKSHLDVCRILQAQGALIKSLQTQLASWGAQPVTAPRALPRTQGFGGAVPRPFGADGDSGEGQLSKAQILDGLMDLQKACKHGVAACGEDVSFALAKYESTNKISPALYQELESFRRKSA